MNVLTRHKTEFNQLVSLTSRFLRGKSIRPTTPVANSFLQVIGKDRTYKKIPVDIRDVRQHLALCWLEWYKNYQKTKPKAPWKNYVLRRSLWSIRDFLRKEASVTRPLPMPPQDTKKHILDLHWLFNGNEEETPMPELTSYERYLLFLRYACGFTVDEIAKIVYKSRNTIRLALVALVSRIRSEENAKANTSRSCD